MPVLLHSASSAVLSGAVVRLLAATASSGWLGQELLIIPEPANIALIGSGLLAIGTFLKRRGRKSGR